MTAPETDSADYTALPGLHGVHLEDSFVLAITEDAGEIEFAIDAVLTPAHPRYHALRPGEARCFEKLRLRFPNVRRADWQQRSHDVRTDAAGETDLGHIDSFYRLAGRYHLGGDWGAVVIDSDAPVIAAW